MAVELGTQHVVLSEAKAFGFLMPGEVRVFSLADRAEADAWVTAD